MVELRVLAASDVTAIHNWPAYPPEFAELDYALRTNGWLAEHRNRRDTWIYVAELNGEMVAFTLLAKTGAAKAEFRIALRADRLGLGLGTTITAMMLDKGFAELKLAYINLIVRKNNLRAIHLYQRIGFLECGECLRNVDGVQVSFLEMEISSGKYRERLMRTRLTIMSKGRS